MLALKAFFEANALKLVGTLFALLSVLAVLFGAKQSGRNAEKAAELSRLAKLTKRGHDVEDEIRLMPDGGSAGRLRDEWSRD